MGSRRQSTMGYQIREPHNFGQKGMFQAILLAAAFT